MDMTTDLIEMDELASTNDYAKKYASGLVADAGRITVITARHQTKGRGQMGNTWESEDGKNLLFSILCHPLYIRANAQYVLSAAIALSTCAAIKEMMGEAYADHIRIKWPNDIYYKDKKMAGILIENDLMGSTIRNSIIGVGIDVNQTIFVSDAPNPISMADIGGREYNCSYLLNSIIDRFATMLESLQNNTEESAGHIFEEYMNTLFRNDGNPYRFKDAIGEFDARITDVDRTGRITLTDVAGTHRRYEFKEVSFIL